MSDSIDMRVLDLLGGHLLGGEHGIQLVIGHEAARLGGLHKLLDRRIGQVEQRAVALGGFRGGAVCRFCILGVSHGFENHPDYDWGQGTGFTGQ